MTPVFPFKAAAASFAVEATAAPVQDRSELETVFAAQAREPNGGLIVMPDSFLTTHRAEITSLVARYRLPVVYPYRLFAELALDGTWPRGVTPAAGLSCSSWASCVVATAGRAGSRCSRSCRWRRACSAPWYLICRDPEVPG
jgi:hypothetical protein